MILRGREVVINGRAIGPNQAPYIIAEISGNHNGEMDRAFRIMEAAKTAGADAVKLQTYTAETMTIDHDGPGFVIDGGLWDGKKLYELYQEAGTPWDWHEALFARGRELDLTVFSTPFDATAVDFLEQLNAPAYKIASFEVIDTPLIKRIAETGKPVIMSTGMASLGEIDDAVATLRNNGCKDLIVLHCISGYPTPVEDSNLRVMPHLAKAFDVIPGLSDHTLGTAVSVAAVALGACVVEKHVTLRRDDGGPDAAFSLEPDELRLLVETSHSAHAALGTVDYTRKESEKSMATYRRSLYAVADIAAGDRFTKKSVRSIRPGYGLPPKHMNEVLAGNATKDIPRGTPLSWSLIG